MRGLAGRLHTGHPTTGTSLLTGGSKGTWRMSITTTKSEKRLIAMQAREVAAKRLLEIGCFKGHTTAVLSRVAQETNGVVVAIDPMRWSSKPANIAEWVDTVLHPFSYERAFWRTLERHGEPERVLLERSLSTHDELLRSDAPHLREFDFVFIDGEHLYDSVLADFEHWGRRVRPGGKILFHDCVRRFPEVLAAVRDIAEHAGYRLSWPEPQTIAVLDVLRAEEAGPGASPAWPRRAVEPSGGSERTPRHPGHGPV